MAPRPDPESERAPVDGNPLQNIADTHRVRWVIANGRMYDADYLVRGNARTKAAGGTEQTR